VYYPKTAPQGEPRPLKHNGTKQTNNATIKTQDGSRGAGARVKGPQGEEGRGTLKTGWHMIGGQRGLTRIVVQRESNLDLDAQRGVRQVRAQAIARGGRHGTVYSTKRNETTRSQARREKKSILKLHVLCRPWGHVRRRYTYIHKRRPQCWSEGVHRAIKEAKATVDVHGRARHNVTRGGDA